MTEAGSRPYNQPMVTTIDGSDMSIPFTLTINAVAFAWAGSTVTTTITDLLDNPAAVTALTFTQGAAGAGTISLTAAQKTTLGVGTFKYSFVITVGTALQFEMGGQFSIHLKTDPGNTTLGIAAVVTSGTVAVTVTATGMTQAQGDARYPQKAATEAITGAWTIGTKTGNAIKLYNWTDTAARSVGDGVTQIVDLVHDAPSDFMFHISSGTNNNVGAGGGGFFFGLGIDVGGGAFLIRNKNIGVGFVLNQEATIAATNAYGIKGSQSSIAPWCRVVTGGANHAAFFSLQADHASTDLGLVQINSTVAGHAPLLRLQSASATTGDKILNVLNTLGQVGSVDSDTGLFNWQRGMLLTGTSDYEVQGSARLTVRDAAGAAMTKIYMDYASSEVALETRRYSGAPTTHYGWRIITATDHLAIEGTPGAQSIGSETWTRVLHLRRDRIGFFGTTAVNAKTGWTVATGTATRTTFDTTTVTLQVLAEHVKALIDDLHQTAGYGLIRT